MENGFIAQENCFVSPAGRNNSRKNSMNSAGAHSLQMIRLNTAGKPIRAALALVRSTTTASLTG
jgi:hypothetical protein